MLDPGALVKKHRAKGVFIDTNLLVLLLVGRVNIQRIGTFKRTKNFTADDFHGLVNLANWFGSPIFSTPHVLSQVSDLTDLSGWELIAIRRLFKATVADIEERHDAARILVQDSMFERFGLGDVSIASVCKRNILVLTADLQLYVQLASLGLDTINFNHVRALGWHLSRL
jgi:hypothetical protein